MQANTLITIVAIVAALAVAVTFAARRLSAARARFVSRYAFPARLERRVRELHPHLGPAQAALVIEGLRQYFLACLAAQKGGIARHVGMPSKAVDDAWHEFLLMKREYAQFCLAAFGRHLTHVPDERMKEPIGDALANTLHQLRRAAPGAAGWATLGAMPLLFALDRELGVNGGYKYDAAALMQLEQHREKKMASNGGGACGGFSSSCDSGGSGGCDSGGGSCGGGGCGSS